MIFYSDEKGIIPSTGIKNLEGVHDLNLKLPSIAIGVFSEHLYNDIVKKYNCAQIGKFGGSSISRPIHILNYKDKEFTLFLAGISGPWISSDIEELNVNGVNTFIIFGNCGVLDSKIEDCSIIIPTKAYRDEGTSYHYLPDSESVELNEKYKEMFEKILEENDFSYTEGATWTTDAFYRETREKINYFKSKGAVCVEMEGASIGAVCQYKNLDYFTFYYAGDNLDATEWDARSLSQLINFDKKVKVPVLALELAYKIAKNN